MSKRVECLVLFKQFRNPLNYTYENDVLTVDLNFGNELVSPVAFECDGGEAYFETPEYSLFRLNSDCN